MIQLEPGNHRGWFLLASVLAPATRTNDAITAYRKVVELKPTHAGGWLGLGHVLKTVRPAGRRQLRLTGKCISLKPCRARPTGAWLT